MTVRKETLGDDVTVYLGDCREILPTLCGAVAFVTDPPYGIGFVKGNGGRPGAHGGAAGRNIAAITGDDAPFDPSMLIEAEDAILWGANHFAAQLPHGRWLAWDKLAGTPEYDSFSDVEFAWRSGRGKDRIFSHLWKGLVRGSENNGERRQHPTQKPIALMDWCVKMVASHLTIADPYMGVGTTGVATVRLGRKFIGIEIEPNYFDIACRRIEKELSQPRLFSEPKPTPAVQETML